MSADDDSPMARLRELVAFCRGAGLREATLPDGMRVVLGDPPLESSAEASRMTPEEAERLRERRKKEASDRMRDIAQRAGGGYR